MKYTFIFLKNQYFFVSLNFSFFQTHGCELGQSEKLILDPYKACQMTGNQSDNVTLYHDTPGLCSLLQYCLCEMQRLDSNVKG